MKSKMLLFYSMFLNTYYYSQNKDEETSRRDAYAAIRNLIGLAFFLSSVVILAVIICVFKLKMKFLDGPGFFLIVGVCLYYYLFLTKKFLKPIFDNVELKKEKPPKNYYYVFTIVLVGLFSGGMYVLGRLLTIYLCG
jgi:FtsH-binding integral membrane protein